MTAIISHTDGVISGKTRYRVLVADDDPILCEMMIAHLGKEMDVTCAENGQVAWEKLIENDFDLAIIDLGMPKLDGFGLIRYLRQTPKTVDLPIFVATSRGDQEAIEQAFSSGASGFITKPINWSLLIYNLKFIIKSGQVEKQFRASEHANKLAIRTKDNLLNLLSTALEKHQTDAGTNTSHSKITDAIYLSRLLSASMAINFNHVDINELITEAIKSCQLKAEKKSVKILGRHSLDNMSINVDRSIWLETLKRLLMQGIKSAPAGGVVEVIPGGQRDGSLVISIRDNGLVKRQTETEAAMNILANEVPLTTTDSSIPDLNLPIIKYSAEIHNGRVLFHNNLGSGNIAALWLPTSRVHIDQLDQSA